ncbi:General transcription factor 3C polypeptide 3 [Echinococcus granulosus]|nr:General transcription factor 3C polypeptide 3 [Echinococcus granulosus]
MEDTDRALPEGAKTPPNEPSFEIIDLQELFPSNTPSMKAEVLNEDLSSIPSTSLSKTHEQVDSAPMGIEDQLYSNYLSGAISFDELMKELHAKTNLDRTGSNSKKAARRRPRPPPRNQRAKSGSEFKDPLYEPESDFGDERLRRSRKSKQSAPRKKWDLKLELANYLGEAERHLNNGNFDKTEEICRNIINAAPHASAPYVVLADMFYRQDRRKDSQEHMLQAAERNPRDSALWMNLVDFSEDEGDLKQAIVYARNAMRSARNDSEIRHRLVSLLMATGQEKEALRVRLTALLFGKNNDPRKAYNQIVKIAEEFAALGDPGGCIRTYELAFEKLPEICPTKDQLRVLDLFQEGDRPEEAFKFFLMYWGVSLICENGQVASPYRVPSNTAIMESIRRCEFAEDMNVVVLIRFFILMLKYNLGSVDHLNSLIASSSTKEFRRSHGLFFDLAKSCKSAGLISEGLAIAGRLTTTPKIKPNPKALCLLGDLQVESNLHEEALSTYRHIINRLDPRCTEARLALGNLLRRLGDEKTALEVLEPSLLRISQPDAQETGVEAEVGDNSTEDEDDDDDDEGDDSETSNSDRFSDSVEEEDEESGGDNSEAVEAEALTSAVVSGGFVTSPMLCNDPTAMRLAFERCKLLDSPATVNQFLEEACRLLFSDVMQIYSCERPGPAVMFQYYLSKHPSVQALAHLDEQTDPALRVSSEDLWATCCCRVIEILIKRADYVTLDRFLSWASVLPWIVETSYRRRMITHLYISNALQVGHGETAMEAMRQIEKEFSHLNQYWNLLNIASTTSRELRLTRFLLRRIAKDRDNLGASLMSCGDCMARGSSRYSIALMADIRSRFPNNPLVSLLLAVCFLNISVHKHLFSRHKTVLQCLGFLGEYRQLRGECQETYFNIARACHQCMLGHIAIPYYEKVLEMEPVGSTEEEKRLLDLRMEAAYNLQLLYQQNKNPTMARYIMQKYLVIE